MSKNGVWTWAIGVLTALGASAVPGAALGCGGLFCSGASPVYQAGERIMFAGDARGVVVRHVDRAAAEPDVFRLA